jgi:outer membrane receptor for ferrienterochelin and colicin
VPFSSLAPYGVTYQSITQQQQQAIDLRGGPNAATVVVTQQVNSDALLKVNGIELTWAQPLDMLPIKGFGFNANYTKINQSATNNSGFIATGVAPYTYNLTGYYENNGFMVRLAQTFSKASQSTNSPQNGIPAANLFADSYKQLDLSSRVDIGKLMGWQYDVQISFDVWNVSKAKQRQYFQFENAAFTEYDPGRTYVLGLRSKF